MGRGWLALGGLFVALTIALVTVAIWQAIYFVQHAAPELNQLVITGLTVIQLILVAICGVLAFMCFRSYREY